MTESDSYHRGDVVLVPMDFTDGTGSNVRPAIVVSADRYHQLSPDVLIASSHRISMRWLIPATILSTSG